MNKRKGFTLIELLAVIVVLAVIALIIIPVVLNVIKDAVRALPEETLGKVSNLEYQIELLAIQHFDKLDLTGVPTEVINKIGLFQIIKYLIIPFDLRLLVYILGLFIYNTEFFSNFLHFYNFFTVVNITTIHNSSFLLLMQLSVYIIILKKYTI